MSILFLRPHDPDERMSGPGRDGPSAQHNDGYQETQPYWHGGWERHMETHLQVMEVCSNLVEQLKNASAADRRQSALMVDAAQTQQPLQRRSRWDVEPTAMDEQENAHAALAETHAREAAQFAAQHLAPFRAGEEFSHETWPQLAPPGGTKRVASPSLERHERATSTRETGQFPLEPAL